MKRFNPFSWLWFLIGAFYFLVPLWGTFVFSLQKERGTLSLSAYQSALTDPKFLETFVFSNIMAVCTIVASLALIIPTAYWVHLRVPKARPLVEFVTLLPFVIPAIVLVFGLIRTFSRPVSLGPVPLFPALTETDLGTNILLVGAYVVLSLPYMYRSVDAGLRAMDVSTLTEAAQSLGANWVTILIRIVIPNLRSALLSGSLLTFAIVVGELTIASFLARPAFGPYLALLGNHKVYEPAALAIISFLLTWVAMLVIDIVTAGSRTRTITGAR